MGQKQAIVGRTWSPILAGVLSVVLQQYHPKKTTYTPRRPSKSLHNVIHLHITRRIYSLFLFCLFLFTSCTHVLSTNENAQTKQSITFDKRAYANFNITSKYGHTWFMASLTSLPEVPGSPAATHNYRHTHNALQKKTGHVL